MCPWKFIYIPMFHGMPKSHKKNMFWPWQPWHINLWYCNIFWQPQHSYCGWQNQHISMFMFKPFKSMELCYDIFNILHDGLRWEIPFSVHYGIVIYDWCFFHLHRCSPAGRPIEQGSFKTSSTEHTYLLVVVVQRIIQCMSRMTRRNNLGTTQQPTILQNGTVWYSGADFHGLV